MKVYKFWYEWEVDGFSFTVNANDIDEAFNEAYDIHGPKVENMICQEQGDDYDNHN